MTKQEAVIRYIQDNYLQFNRLRHDVVSDKLQVRIPSNSPGTPSNSPFRGGGLTSGGGGLISGGGEGTEHWRELTKHDINSIVCHCAQEYDANITSREVMTALQSDLVPDVHPLREYINALPRYTPDQPDWIDFVDSQVK